MSDKIYICNDCHRKHYTNIEPDKCDCGADNFGIHELEKSHIGITYEDWLLETYPDEIHNKEDFIEKIKIGYMYDEYSQSPHPKGRRLLGQELKWEDN